jgi:hypothetical protein
VDKLVKEFKQKNPEFSLWLEPGRFPIAEAGKCNPICLVPNYEQLITANRFQACSCAP